jgi:hypothetical protein
VLPHHRAHLVHERGADVLAGLPEREQRSLVILDERHAAGRPDVDGAVDVDTAELAHAGNARVHVLDGHVGEPARRTVSQTRDLLCVEAHHGVDAPCGI